MSDPPDLEEKRPDTQRAELGEEAKELLGEANRAYRTSLSEPRAWDALKERRARRNGWALHAGLAAVSAAMIVWLVQSTEKTTDSIVNELQPEPPQVVVSVDAVSRTEEPVTTVRQKPIEEPQNEALTKNRQVRPRSPVSEEHCRALAVQGKSDQAFSCFEKLGHRGGIEGDVAQLEMARLALKLGRGQTGLEILEHHRARLAKSALRGEAAQLRVRVLYQLGMNLQALKESEAVLSAPWGPAAAVEMRWLRGRIYEERLGDCSRAIDEYLTLLGNPGPQADNAEFRRARCLEKVGRSLEATTAYQRYLKRIRPGNAEEARTALRRLGQ